jgi:hypothetical protein
MVERKRYRNRFGAEVSYDELNESERNWHSLSNPQMSIEDWCQNTEQEPEDTARWPVSS